MKTITEYRPMIFSMLAAQSERHSRECRRLKADLLAAIGYGVGGLWLSFDTGFAPWQWQFWLMFAPLFVAGELAWHAWAGKQSKRGCAPARPTRAKDYSDSQIKFPNSGCAWRLDVGRVSPHAEMALRT